MIWMNTLPLLGVVTHLSGMGGGRAVLESTPMRGSVTGLRKRVLDSLDPRRGAAVGGRP
jgi:hypothetical protein